MKNFLHAFRTTFHRFRREILAFWLFSAALSLFLVGIEVDRSAVGQAVPYTQFSPRVGGIEAVAAIWLVARLMFSEPALLTQGGWRTRPFGRAGFLAAPFAVLAAVILPAVLLRILPAQAAAGPDLAAWCRILAYPVLPVLGGFAGVALLMGTAGSLLPRRNPGWGKRIAFALICIFALAGSYFALAQSYRFTRHHNGNWYSGNGSRYYANEVLGMQKLLEPGGTYVGDWMTISPPAPAMKVLYRMPLKTGLTGGAPGIRAEITGVDVVKDHLEVKMKLVIAGQGIHQEVSNAVPVVRYAGNIYACCRNGSWWAPPPLAPLDPIQRVESLGIYDSPINEAWNKRNWDELLADAELIFFVWDRDQPEIQTLDGLVNPPERQAKKREPGLAGEVKEIFDHLDFAIHQAADERRKQAAGAALILPAEAMPHILAQRIWSNVTWDAVVKPFLLKHAAESDKPVLLERMTTEPRLGEIFLAKGWRADAMPLLKTRLKERVPLDLGVVRVLAEEQDATLAADLAAVVVQLPAEVATLEPLLRSHPGFDWPRFVHLGWQRRKYGLRYYGEIQPFDLWAAQEGDASAFDYIAEKAARRESGQAERLRSLITGQPQDTVNYARTNLGKMKFDPTTKTWTTGQ